MLRMTTTGDMSNLSGQVVITAEAGAWDELDILAAELLTRPGMVDGGRVIMVPPVEAPPEEGAPTPEPL